MKQLCCFCLNIYGEKEPMSNKSFTAGICPDCLKLSKRELNKLVELRKAEENIMMNKNSHSWQYNNKMKLKDLVIKHPNGFWEAKEPLKVKTLLYESVVNAGFKISPRRMSKAFGVKIKNLLEKELEKSNEANIWEISI